MKKLLILCVISIFSIGIASAQDGVQVVQWASNAEASSEYGSSSWSAERATGEPDVLACEDNGNSWASAEIVDGESLTVFFDKPVIPTQVNIYQNLAPGGITSIEILTVDGEELRIRNSADPGGDCPTVFSVDLPGGLPESNGVRINLDQADLGNWNEIDAVELVGFVEGGAGDDMPSSIEAGAFPEYTVVSNSDSTPTTRGDDAETTTSTTVDTSDFGGEWGTTVNCPDGTTIENGIEVTVIQQRPGSNYRLTAVGINGFDPVMAVQDDFGNILCNDDSSEAATYGANLPTTGQIAPSSTSSQIRYSVTGNDFANITIIVGGFGGSAGEFLLTVEGMIATSADGLGDPFSLYISPAMLMSEVDPTAYMISVVGSFDPLMFLVDSEYEVIQENGSPIGCDDAGASGLCYGVSENLAGSFVSRSGNRRLAGGNLDAMLTIPLQGSWGGYFNYMMSGNNSFGDYVVAFHLGTAENPE